LLVGLRSKTSLALSIWARQTKRDLLNRTFWAIGLASAFIATFLAWNTQHESLNRPNLIAHIDSYAVSDLPGETGSALVTVEASIQNSGSPSIVRNWSLDVQTQSATYRAVLYGDARLKEDAAHNAVYYEPPLFTETTDAPIPLGAQRAGFIRGKISNVTPNGLRAEHIRALILRFQDVYDRKYSLTSHTPE
jgi:hypothetical protein